MDKIARSFCAAQDGWGRPTYIDAGASGAVYRVAHPIYGKVALKIYDPKYFQGDDALISSNRIALQMTLVGHQHDSIIEVLDAGEIKAHFTWYILMSYCPWKSLDKIIHSIPDSKIGHLIAQLVHAVQFLDSLCLVHRDIKPANIVVSEDFTNLKLLDFGVIRSLSVEEGNGTDLKERKLFVATAQYSPPEYLTREESRDKDGFDALNIYQVGAVLHDLIMKMPLFGQEAMMLNRYVLYRAITNRVPIVFSQHAPPHLVSVCRSALLKDPVTRLAAVKLHDFLDTGSTKDALRSRLAAQRLQPQASERPSISTWKSKVRRWVSGAAKAEKEALGPLNMREVEFSQGVRWVLEFPQQARLVDVLLTARVSDGYLSLVLAVDKPQSLTVPILEIGPEGPSLEADLTTMSISDQLLYLVDLADAPVDPDEACTGVDACE